MSLPSAHLDAFVAIAKTASFSKASQLLHLTQSGLSQKIKGLEEVLGLTLFIRTPSGVLLTEQGERLLRYCQVRDSMESELLEDMSLSTDKALSGVLRVASYSSVFRSVVLPALTQFLKEHPGVRIEFMCGKMHELPDKLQRAETDFIIMDYKLEKANIETQKLGQEKYVAIKPKSPTKELNVFLDNDSNDQATANFFKVQKMQPQKYLRSYFDDCYGIIDGVAQGIGNAVMPEHLVKKNSSIKIVKGFKSMSLDVVLHYYRQPFYSKLHQSLIDSLVRNCRKYLN